MSYPGYPQQGAPGGYPSPYHATTQLSYPGYPQQQQQQQPSYPSNPPHPGYPPQQPQNMYTLNPTASMCPPLTSSSIYPSQNPHPGYPPQNNSQHQSGFSQNSSYPTNNMPPYPGSNNPGMQSSYPSQNIGFTASAPTSFNTPQQPAYNPSVGSAPQSFNAPPLPPYSQMGNAPTSFNPSSQSPYNPSVPQYPSNSYSQNSYNPAGTGAGLYPALQTQSSYSLDPNATSMHGSQSQAYSTMGAATGGSMYGVQRQSVYSSPPSMQGYNAVQPKGTPTVRPHPGFNARGDAETMRRAMKGFGTDEQAIITVLCNRTNEQRLQIAMQFKTLYGKDMTKDLKSELSGRFEELALAMVTPLPQFYAQELHKSVQGLGTDEAAIIEVLCTLDNHYIRTIRSAYEAMYRTSLERDMGGDASGSFKRLLVSLCGANRDESTAVDHAACVADAQALHRAGALKFGTDESTFNAILCSRSYTNLRQIFAEYQKLAGHDIEKAVKSEFSGDIEAGLLAIVKSVRNKSAFFAERLYASMQGMGTKDRTLIRICVTRCEVDMADIKREFQAKFGKTLESFISGDTSGDYKKCLIALIS